MGIWDVMTTAFKQGYDGVQKSSKKPEIKRVEPPKPPQKPVERPAIIKAEPLKPEAQQAVDPISVHAPLSKQESREKERKIPLSDAGRNIIHKEYYRLHKSLKILRTGTKITSVNDPNWMGKRWYALEQERIANGHYAQRNAQATREELYYYATAELMVNEGCSSVQALKKAGVEFPDVVIAIIKREISKNAEGQQDRDTQYEKIAGKKRYKSFLKDNQYDTNPFPLSTAPENADALAVPDARLLYDMYVSVLDEYESRVEGSDKTDFINGSGEGYKLHLNVPVANVREVSEYLITQNYHHKYLSGGDAPESVFTLYIGSHQLAFSLSKKLSDELSPYLAKPARTDEIELAPNIVGRFCAVDNDLYTQYGIYVRGMSNLKFFAWCPDEKDPIKLKEFTEDAFEETYESLADDYGEYFHGCAAES